MIAYSQLDIYAPNLLKNLNTYNPNVTMPMVKGNGYGLGMLELARFLDDKGFPYLGVSHPLEAQILIESGIKTPIFLLSFLPSQAKWIVDLGVTVVVDTPEKIQALANYASKPHPIHLKVNLGMNRFGADPKEIPLLFHLLQSKQNLVFEGLLSHLPSPDLPSFDDKTCAQIAQFNTLYHQLPLKPKWVHVLSTHAIDRFPPTGNLVRIGMGMFFPHPVLKLTSTIIAIKSVAAHEGVGYRSIPIGTDRKIAIVGLGYYDGWLPEYRNSFVLIQGQPAPLIGEICMDFLFADISHIPFAAPGDPVELFGPQLPLEKLANLMKVNPRQILTSLSARIQRKWVYANVSETNRTHQESQIIR
jgi:alanine racemase